MCFIKTFRKYWLNVLYIYKWLPSGAYPVQDGHHSVVMIVISQRGNRFNPVSIMDNDLNADVVVAETHSQLIAQYWMRVLVILKSDQNNCNFVISNIRWYQSGMKMGIIIIIIMIIMHCTFRISVLCIGTKPATFHWVFIEQVLQNVKKTWNFFYFGLDTICGNLIAVAYVPSHHPSCKRCTQAFLFITSYLWARCFIFYFLPQFHACHACRCRAYGLLSVSE